MSLRISRVVGSHLQPVEQLSAETQLTLLATVRMVLARIGAATVLLYEAAWRRATVKTALKTSHRVHTLPHEIQGHKRRASNETGFRLGARAHVLLAA